MRVAELYQPHQFRLVERPASDPAPGEVQVRVEACGICGSDLHYFAEGGICGTPNVYPMVLGHEPTGSVVKAGPGVSGWVPGDRVALEPAVYCYHCEQCLSGHHNLCAHLHFLSAPPIPVFTRIRQSAGRETCCLSRLRSASRRVPFSSRWPWYCIPCVSFSFSPVRRLRSSAPARSGC